MIDTYIMHGPDYMTATHIEVLPPTLDENASEEMKRLDGIARYYASIGGGRYCRYCGDGSADVTLQIEHMIPCCQGGRYLPNNLTTACISCNNLKSGRTVEEFRSLLEYRLGVSQFVFYCEAIGQPW